MSKNTAVNSVKKVLFVNHKIKNCGVYRYGYNVYNTIKNISKFEFQYVECDQFSELKKAIKSDDFDAVIYNYHVDTLPFVGPRPLRRTSFLRKGISLPKKLKRNIHICLLHEIVEQEVHTLTNRNFDYYIYGDPQLKTENPRVFTTGRLLKPYTNTKPLPKIPTFGSYGFAHFSKGFHHLIECVQNEFDQAIIRINMPSNGIADHDGTNAKKLAKEYHSLIKKKDISLEITHDFLDERALLDFLASNSVNVFPYLDMGSNGIASAPDHAIAVQRPIAIRKCRLM